MTVRTVGELTLEKNKLIKKKMIEKTDVVDGKSFVVGREFDESGNMINPLLQFSTMYLGDMKQALIGKKVGDFVEFKEFKTKLEILEIYGVKI
jgi:hypothetical protein